MVKIIYTAHYTSFWVAKKRILYDYQCMRKLNVVKLKEYLVIRGKLSKETLAVETGISFYKIERMLLGMRDATKPEILALCSATGLTADQLFPIFDEKKQSA